MTPSATNEITIFIAEDHLISRMGLKMLLEQTPQFSVIGEAEDGQAAIDSIRKLKPEVIMMDLGLPKIDGIAATEIIKRELPQSKVLVFTTAEDDQSIFGALKAGADGYCLKTISGEMLATAIHSVLSGAAWLDPGIANKVLRAQTSPQANAPSDLTDSKIKLLALVEQGKNFDEIATELKINDSLAKGLLNELLVYLKGDGAAGTRVSLAKQDERASALGINPGDTIAEHYKIERRLGFGGMGCVFEANHTFITRRVAVKTLHEHLATNQETLQRFKTEAEASAAVTHPNLVTIHDFGLFQGKIPYIVMEYLDGKDFGDVIKDRGKIDAQTGKSIFLQVCDALSAAHQKGIVHRDLKPSNIMLIGEEPFTVKLVDFGIAKILAEAQKNLTQSGETVGSPAYMSPEQCYARPVDHRSDLYSLGCVMYEAFTGRVVFEHSWAMETMASHITAPPSRRPLEGVGLDKRLIDLIMQLLEKEPAMRPASAAEVRKILMEL